jgi:hypothetical protein
MKKTRRLTLQQVDEVICNVSYDGQRITVTLRDYSGPTIKEARLECCPYIVEEIAGIQEKVLKQHKMRLRHMREAVEAVLKD